MARADDWTAGLRDGVAGDEGGGVTGDGGGGEEDVGSEVGDWKRGECLLDVGDDRSITLEFLNETFLLQLHEQ